MNIEIDLDELLWEDRVMRVALFENDVELAFRQGKLQTKEYKIIKKRISCFWLNVWDNYPHQNTSVKEAFEANFA